MSHGLAGLACRASCSGSAGYVTRAVCVVSAITIIVNQLITNCLTKNPPLAPAERGRRGSIRCNFRLVLQCVLLSCRSCTISTTCKTCMTCTTCMTCHCALCPELLPLRSAPCALSPALFLFSPSFSSSLNSPLH